MGSGERISYNELIPPEARAFRKGLYNYLGGTNPLYSQQIPSYPGTLPYTQAPDMAQMAGLTAIMQLLGYPGYTWQGLPGIPPVTAGDGGGGGGNDEPDRNGGGGGGTGGGGTGGTDGGGGNRRYRPPRESKR